METRKLSDMHQVVYDKEWLKTAEDFDLYFMQRGIEKKDDLRYDITIIPAKMLGKEFNKTKGHYHIGKFQETYTVIEGTAIYLLQKLDKNGNVLDVYAVETKKGESIIIPSYYGHVTINPSESEELKMSNWGYDLVKSDYSPFEKMQGACYYYTKQGWIKNENYKNVPELRFEKPIKELPKDLSFLK